MMEWDKIWAFNKKVKDENLAVVVVAADPASS